ncbi:MAG: alpha/beta hydrolase fold domain-containing protein [Arenicellaceae bacterium]|nr:alpha/beta hydrolase fold domain-containing protein [Arenicellaceae bacterium]
MKNVFVVNCSVFFSLVYTGMVAADPSFLRSTYDLEDPSGYCLDIPGFGPRMRKEAPIGTHTCKYGIPGFYVDELFELTSSNFLRLPEYDLCLAADTIAIGSHINTIPCDLGKVHSWAMHANGNVTPEIDTSLCMTMSREKVYVNTSVANLTANSGREVSLQNCARDSRYYQSWKLSDPNELETKTANTLRNGMDIETARLIRELGYEIRPEETAEAYASHPRMFTSADVTISDVIKYGLEEGERLQVYIGNNRNSPRNAAPMIILVHGGGFSNGGLNSLQHAATQFAALGYIAINITYPLAPTANWPSGGNSVANAVRWAQENAVEYKGDLGNIFLLGHSAGGAHVADFVFRPGNLDGEIPDIAGAILASPVLTLDPTNPASFVIGYFGEDTDSWKAKQTLGNVERTSIPVLTLVAEFDPNSFHRSTAGLLNELVVNKAVSARLSQMRGHNHISYITSIGTKDTQSLEEILDFIATRN